MILPSVSMLLSTTLTVGIVTPHALCSGGVEKSRSLTPAPLLDLVHSACANHGGFVCGMLVDAHAQHTPHVAHDIRAARVRYGRGCVCCSEGFSSAFCG